MARARVSCRPRDSGRWTDYARGGGGSKSIQHTLHKLSNDTIRYDTVHYCYLLVLIRYSTNTIRISDKTCKRAAFRKRVFQTKIKARYLFHYYYMIHLYANGSPNQNQLGGHSVLSLAPALAARFGIPNPLLDFSSRLCMWHQLTKLTAAMPRTWHHLSNSTTTTGPQRWMVMALLIRNSLAALINYVLGPYAGSQ